MAIAVAPTTAMVMVMVVTMVRVSSSVAVVIHEDDVCAWSSDALTVLNSNLGEIK